MTYPRIVNPLQLSRLSMIFSENRYPLFEIMLYESPMDFDDAFRARLRDLLVWRRDVRRFRTEPLPSGMLERLIALACLAPSVGLSQPWRFVMVESPERRRLVLDDFATCNAAALASYEGEQAARYAALKLAGLAEAPSQLAVFADRGTETGHGLGRRTMPEMAEYSAVAAITAMWLAARADGIGMGWISILDPLRVKAILDVPEAWRFIGYFCLGYPEAENAEPELERAGWEQRRPADGFVVRR
jgi:5,6-dimethylbenzimidazole synthase